MESATDRAQRFDISRITRTARQRLADCGQHGPGFGDENIGELEIECRVACFEQPLGFIRRRRSLRRQIERQIVEGREHLGSGCVGVMQRVERTRRLRRKIGVGDEVSVLFQRLKLVIELGPQCRILGCGAEARERRRQLFAMGLEIRFDRKRLGCRGAVDNLRGARGEERLQYPQRIGSLLLHRFDVETQAR